MVKNKETKHYSDIDHAINDVVKHMSRYELESFVYHELYNTVDSPEGIEYMENQFNIIIDNK